MSVFLRKLNYELSANLIQIHLAALNIISNVSGPDPERPSLKQIIITFCHILRHCVDKKLTRKRDWHVGIWL